MNCNDLMKREIKLDHFYSGINFGTGKEMRHYLNENVQPFLDLHILDLWFYCQYSDFQINRISTDY